MYYIGIDCGTQGTKAIVFDASAGTVIGKGYEKHPIISDDSGKREQKTQWWVDAMFAAIEDALQAAAIDRSLVRAIAISGQQHGLVVLDENKEVIRDVKLWNDTSTADDNEEIIRDAGGNEAVWHAIHTTLPVGYTASKIRYLINHEPELYARTRYVLLPHDYLNYILTGEIVTESSEASGTGYYDVQARAYSKKMLETIDPSNSLADKVPPLIAWETPVGTITEEVATKLGLSVDVLVAAGGGDNTMSALGTGTIIEGACSLSLGTS
ncbi:MAG TPA: FGGY family carbohydrate kinase, partial [Sphaerochaeta sp.]|nr:FGGY family carbohydrate kinase [Sphaerochaeta sp.]